MPVKHFIITPAKAKISKEAIDESRLEAELHLRHAQEIIGEKRKIGVEEDDSLRHVKDRIVVKADIEYKNSHAFSDGTKIRLERNFNNFNRRYTQPVNCIVISGENIVKGSEILVSHNAICESHRINDYKNSFEKEDSDVVRYYSLPIYECFAWKDDDGRMRPMKGFQFGLRVYEPYKGMILGVEPTIITDVLYVTTGELNESVVHTLKASDYSIIYQGDDGREKEIIRFRHSDEEELEREEVVCVNHNLTEMVLNGQLLIGLTATTAKPLYESELVYHDRVY